MVNTLFDTSHQRVGSVGLTSQSPSQSLSGGTGDGRGHDRQLMVEAIDLIPVPSTFYSNLLSPI